MESCDKEELKKLKEEGSDDVYIKFCEYLIAKLSRENQKLKQAMRDLRCKDKKEKNNV